MSDTKKCNGGNEIIVSNTYLSGFYEIIEKIKELTSKNKFENIILVVPDKFSLNAEQIFMERIGLSSVFNVWLTTLSRLVSKVCSDDEKNFNILSKNSGTMLVSQIILKNADKISTYKKISNNYSLAETMYNAINLLKSSGVRPEELKNNFDDTNFGLKVKDIYLIYSEYEKAIKTHIDAITRLQIFNEKIKNDDYIKNSHIFFAMFDGFTNVQIDTLCNLAKNTKSFCLSVCANTVQPNKYIYDNSMFFRIKDSFDSAHLTYSIRNILSKTTEQNNFLSKNLLGYQCDKKFETDNIRLMECENISNEVRYVAGRIKFLINEKNFVFDDINVAVNGLDDYVFEIQKIFDEFDIPYYIDANRKITEHFFVKTLFDIAKFVCNEKTLSNAISIVKSPIFEIDYQKKCDFENYCKKYNIFGKSFFAQFDNQDDWLANAEEVRVFVFDKINKFETEFAEPLTIAQCIEKLKAFMDSISIKSVLENSAQQQVDIIQKQIDLSVLEKFEKALHECDDLIFDEPISKEMFFDMLKSLLNGVNLQTVPLRCDAVFVGDASQSTYYPRKNLFVMGASDVRMPSYQTDAGTITDDEIDRFVGSKRICPTIKELNKREKFKLFNLLLMPANMLELSYSTLVGGTIGQKSEFVTSLQNTILQNNKPLEIQKYAMEELKIFDHSNPKLLAYIVGTTENAIKLSCTKESNVKYLLNKIFSAFVEGEKEKFVDKKERFDIQNAKEYLFNENTTSISQIERYFSCPFMHFVDYGLKPRENPVFDLKANDVGQILHEVAKAFVDNMIENSFDNFDVEDVADNIFGNIMSQQKYNLFLKNKYYLSLLKDESKRFCKAIKYQIDSSDFKPKYTEKKLNGFQLENGLKLISVVDRIDEYKDSLRIVDYKTGSEKFSFKKLYYGLKLQLVSYMKIASQLLQKHAIGTMYMPVKNKFSDFFENEFKSYKLDGILIDDDGTIKHLDKNLIESNESNIISVKYNKDGTLSKKSMSNILSKEELDDILTYTFKVLTNALNEMIDGYIEPKPYFDGNPPCDFCKYKSICHYQIAKQGYRKLENKNKASFKLEYNDTI